MNQERRKKIRDFSVQLYNIGNAIGEIANGNDELEEETSEELIQDLMNFSDDVNALSEELDRLLNRYKE